MRELLHRYFVTVRLFEAYGVAFAERLARAPLLLADERAYAGDRLLADERRHMGIARALTALFGPDEVRAVPLRDLPQLSDLAALMTLHVLERHFARALAPLRPIVVAALPGAAVPLGSVHLDELEHVRWGRTVLDRLKAEDAPDYAATSRRYLLGGKGHNAFGMAHALTREHVAVLRELREAARHA